MNPSSLAKSQELLRSLRLKESAEQLPVIVKEAEESECSYLTFLRKAFKMGGFSIS